MRLQLADGLPMSDGIKQVMATLLLMVAVMSLGGCQMTPERAQKKAYKFYDKGDYAKALDYLEIAWIGKPDDPEFLVRYAYCLIANQNDPKYAIEVLYENSVRYPDYARTYYLLGNIAFNFSREDRQKNLMQAINFTIVAAELDSTDIKIAMNLAQYYEIAEMPDSALVWYKRAIRIDPKDSLIQVSIDSLKNVVEERDLKSDSTQIKP